LAVAVAYALASQAMLVQATQLRAASPETPFIICHGNGDVAPAPTPPNDEALRRFCHFCVIPTADAALLPDAISGLAISLTVFGSAYFSSADTICITRPASRAGLSRAPPSFA
jgi:hypothetical protein